MGNKCTSRRQPVRQTPSKPMVVNYGGTNIPKEQDVRKKELEQSQATLKQPKFVDTGYDTLHPGELKDTLTSSLLGGEPTNLDEVVALDCGDGLVERGPVILSDGSVYRGQWRDKVMEGKGQLFGMDGSRYLGSFLNGVFDGSGTIEFKNGDRYQGLFKRGKMHGKGIYTQNNGNSFDGTWKEGKREGFGVERYSDGSVYMGPFKNGRREGVGELKSSNGTTYYGTFDDEITGKGKMMWPTGESYSGGFKGGLKHGYGKTTWKSGPVVSQEGTYEEGKMCGRFKCVMRNGPTIRGIYADGVLLREISQDLDAVADGNG